MATVVVVAKPIQPKQKLKWLKKQGVKKKLISSNSNSTKAGGGAVQ